MPSIHGICKKVIKHLITGEAIKATKYINPNFWEKAIANDIARLKKTGMK